jgi:hypothetical protein
MAITVIDIRAEQQAVRTAQFELAISEGKTEAEASNIAAAAGNLVGAKLLSEINLGVVPAPIDPTANSASPGISGVSKAASNTFGTIISTINESLTHECGTNEYIRLFAAKCHGIAAAIAKGIREGINLALQALGIDPALGGIAAKIRRIAEKIAEITYWAKQINKFINDVVLVIAQIRALIDYILSLPKKLLALFQKCLQEALAELRRGIFSILSAGTDELNSDGALSAINELSTQTKNLVDETNKIIDAPSKIISAISNPASLSSSERNDLIVKLFPDNPSPESVFNTFGNGVGA